MDEKMKIKTNYDKTEYITPGKVYELEDCRVCCGIRYGWIIDDFGDVAVVRVGEPCPRLGIDGHWEIVEE